jgi:hypothetical protein
LFKERFTFTLSSGFDEFSLKIYSSRPQIGEQLEEEFNIKISDELVELVD